MTIINDLMSQGIPALPAKTVGQAIIDLNGQTTSTAPTRSVGATLTAAGTDITNALVLTSLVNVVTSAAASTGVQLPSATPIGQIVTVQNNGANAINIWPHSASGTLNGGSGGAAVTTAAAAGAICIRNSSLDSTVWVIAKES
jgi:hypothetical protein